MPWARILILWGGLTGCTWTFDRPEPAEPSQAPYSFVVAGHVYGKPGAPVDQGVHPPFREALPAMRETEGMDFMMLTGDVVQVSRPETWNSFWQSLVDWDLPVYIAPGNHDLSSRALYEEQAGDTYYAFMHNRDLHIVLEPFGSQWNIEGEQLAFFMQTLDSLGPAARHIFIYTHQVIWWEPDNRYGQHLILNSTAGRGDRLNFWPVIFPRLLRLEQPVYWFAGDVGAIRGNKRLAVFVADEGGIQLIGSGMGNEREDNALIVSVGKDGAVDIRLWALQGNDPDAMGVLAEYELPE
ncbi:MAG: metallophosphoesterase [Bacteroidota bacterium]